LLAGLEQNHIASCLIDCAQNRLTVAVKQADLRRAQQVLHDRLIAGQDERESSIRAGPAGPQSDRKDTKENKDQVLHR
jgi:hypothetical protein